MNQVLNANDELSKANTDICVETDSDTSSITGYEPSSEVDSKLNFDHNNTDKANLISGVLATEVDKSWISLNKERKSNKSDIAKQVNLSDKEFEYIHVA